MQVYHTLRPLLYTRPHLGSQHIRAAVDDNSPAIGRHQHKTVLFEQKGKEQAVQVHARPVPSLANRASFSCKSSALKGRQRQVPVQLTYYAM